MHVGCCLISMQEYYKWKKEQASEDLKRKSRKLDQRSQPLSVEQRRSLLGESSLPRWRESSKQETHIGGAEEPKEAQKTSTQTEHGKHAMSEIAEGDRERLKQAMQNMFTKGSEEGNQSHEGGLYHSSELPGERLQSSGAVSVLSERPSKLKGQSKNQNVVKIVGELQSFKGPFQPKRWQFEWSPASLLCKRFGLPKHGKSKEKQQEGGGELKVDKLALPETQQKSKEEAPTFLPSRREDGEKEATRGTDCASFCT